MACRKPGRILGSIAADFVIAEWKDDDGPVGPPRLIARLHVHHQDDEAWYVLEGQLCVRRRQEVVESTRRVGRIRPSRNGSHLLESGAGYSQVPTHHDA